MKNNGSNFIAGEKIVSDLPIKETNKLQITKHRPSVTPKIVVCPPLEEVNEPRVQTRRGQRLLKALNRLSWRPSDSDSDNSFSSSSDSLSAQDRSSSSNSESSNDGTERHRRHRSIAYLRRVFQSLSLTPRSQSSSPTERSCAPKKQRQPKRILRTPVTYTYVRGLSGLPTQRVPLHVTKVKVNCGSAGFNR